MPNVLPLTPPSCEALPMGSVECHVCGGSFISLYRHLWKHGLTAEQYRIRYPGAATSCMEVRVRQVNGGREGAVLSREKPQVRITRAAPGSDPRIYDTDAAMKAVTGATPSVQGRGPQKAAG